MARRDKILMTVLRGTSDSNIRFEDLCYLLRSMRFEMRVRGSHRIFTRAGVKEILNLQPRLGGKAKVYQVKQVRKVILKYGFTEAEDEQ